METTETKVMDPLLLTTLAVKMEMMKTMAMMTEALAATAAGAKAHPPTMKTMAVATAVILD